MVYTRPSQISSQLPNGFRFSAGLACRSAAQTTDPSEIATMLLLGAGAPLSTPKSRASSLLLAYVHAPAPTPINPICGGGGSQRGASHRSGPDHSAGRRSLVAAPLTPTRGRGATSLSTPPFNAVSETGGRKEPWPRILRAPPLPQCECESRKATGPLPRWSRRVTWTPVTRPLPARQVPAIFWARHAALRRWPARRDTAREAAKR